MRDYELVFIISPEVPEEEVPIVIERVSGYISGGGGEVREVERWGRRRLAYPIQRHMEGNYVLTHVTLDPNQIGPLEASLGLNEQVIRHLLVRVEESQPA